MTFSYTFLHLLTEWGPQPDLILQALVPYKYSLTKKKKKGKQEKRECIKLKKYPFL